VLLLSKQPIDPGLYRNAMSRFGGHVQLVTTAIGDQQRGVTITAACSVSDSPATVLVCLNNSNPKNDIFFRSGIFALNTLGRPSPGLGRRLFRSHSGQNDERFATGKFDKLVTGAPVLHDALASFDCRVTEIKEMTTHHIIFGEVVAVRFDEAKARASLYEPRLSHAITS
jgi:cob(II)yrinic acid a,c-diamide reductase